MGFLVGDRDKDFEAFTVEIGIQDRDMRLAELVVPDVDVLHQHRHADCFDDGFFCRPSSRYLHWRRAVGFFALGKDPPGESFSFEGFFDSSHLNNIDSDADDHAEIMPHYKRRLGEVP